MKRYLNTARTLGLPLLLMLGSCSDAEVAKEVIAWPGMEVSEFNRLNDGRARPMKPIGSDWIGIDSPVTLTFRQGSEAVRFSGTRLGGGTQVASSDLEVYGFGDAKARVTTIAFNIGGGMEDIAALAAMLNEQCNKLARMAGLEPKLIPDVAALRRSLKAANGASVQICGGDGASFSFQIAATHPDDDRRFGDDYGRAYLDGYLGRALRTTEEQLDAPTKYVR